MCQQLKSCFLLMFSFVNHNCWICTVSFAVSMYKTLINTWFFTTEKRESWLNGSTLDRLLVKQHIFRFFLHWKPWMRVSCCIHFVLPSCGKKWDFVWLDCPTSNFSRFFFSQKKGDFSRLSICWPLQTKKTKQKEVVLFLHIGSD